jgi:hypothetical protein
MNRASLAVGPITKIKQVSDQETKYRVKFGSGTLRVRKELWLALESGKTYRIAYARNSRYLLNAVPLDSDTQAARDTSLGGANNERRLAVAPFNGEAYIPATPHPVIDNTLAFPEGQARALVGQTLLLRGTFSLFLLIIGVVFGLLSGAYLLAAGFIVVALTILAIGLVPAISDITSKSLVKVSGRINKESRRASAFSPNPSTVEIADLELRCSYHTFESLRDGAPYTFTYALRTKFIVAAQRLDM